MNGATKATMNYKRLNKKKWNRIKQLIQRRNFYIKKFKKKGFQIGHFIIKRIELVPSREAPLAPTLPAISASNRVGF